MPYVEIAYIHTGTRAGVADAMVGLGAKGIVIASVGAAASGIAPNGVGNCDLDHRFTRRRLRRFVDSTSGEVQIHFADNSGG